MAMTELPHRLILASASAIRCQLLEKAGLSFVIEPARGDEAVEMASLGARAPEQLAARLAAWKALDVSARNPLALVIGSDQVLALGGKTYTKAADLSVARANLMELRGKTHHLHSAVSLVRDGTVIWRHLGTASLTMRGFSEEFIDGYLERAGSAVLKSVGCYQLEGLGVQLFERIDGDYFTILGLPLLPLLAELRRLGVVAA